MIGLFDDQFAVFHRAGCNLDALELRNELAHRVVQRKAAFVVEGHQGNASDGLGHGVDAKDRVLGHRRASFGVLIAERIEMHQLAAPRHRRYAAGQIAIRDQLPHRRVQLRQPFGTHPNFARLRHRQITAVVGSNGRRTNEQDQQRCQAPATKHRQCPIASSHAAPPNTQSATTLARLALLHREARSPLCPAATDGHW